MKNTSSNVHPVSFRFGWRLTNALNSKCNELGVTRNFLVFAIIKGFLRGVALTDEDIKKLWYNRNGKLDDMVI